MDELIAADMGVDLNPRNTVIEVGGWVDMAGGYNQWVGGWVGGLSICPDFNSRSCAARVQHGDTRMATPSSETGVIRPP